MNFKYEYNFTGIPLLKSVEHEECTDHSERYTNQYELRKHILDLEQSYEVKYSSLYDLVNKEVSEDKIIVIKGKWLTYLRDIIFNYRDRSIYISYYTYDVSKYTFDALDSVGIKLSARAKTMLDISDETVYVKHDYILKKCELDMFKGSIELYDYKTDKKYLVLYDKLYDDSTFSLAELYRRYIDCCFKFEDYDFVKHVEGYNIIDKRVKGLTNFELRLREMLNLHSFSYTEPVYDDITDRDLKYRDVRSFRYKDAVKYHVFLLESVNYWVRLLSFESMLFCVVNSGCDPDTEDLDLLHKWNKLKTGSGILSYSEKITSEIKLIFKGYWFNSSKSKKYTWSRF